MGLGPSSELAAWRDVAVARAACPRAPALATLVSCTAGLAQPALAQPALASLALARLALARLALARLALARLALAQPALVRLAC